MFSSLKLNIMNYLNELDFTTELSRETKVIQKYVDFKMTFKRSCSNLLLLTKVITPRQAYQCFLETFEDGQIPIKEFFYVMALNRGNRLIGIYKVSEGGITGTVVDTRIVVKFLIDVQACSAVICHNHPSGTLQPSYPDIEITRKIKNALKLFEIELHDHIIITLDSFYSMRDNDEL